MSRMGGKRADGWYEMERQYRHNIIPEPPTVTRWQRWLGGTHMTVEDVLLAAKCPKSLTARLIEQELREDGFFHKHYVPDPVIDAFGLRAELERRISGDVAGGRPRKQKVPKAHLPLLERVNS